VSDDLEPQTGPMSSGVERVPHGATFMRSDGREAVTEGALEAIANGILASGVLTSPKPGQRIIDAVWDAQQTLDVLAWADLDARPSRPLTMGEEELLDVGLEGLAPDTDPSIDTLRTVIAEHRLVILDAPSA
jgi:hypothetical protein